MRRRMAGPVAVVLALGTAGPALAASDDLDLAGFAGLADAGHTGSGVVVAVVDSGLDLDHPAFDGRVVPGWDLVDDDARPGDGNGHGTHVAGIVGASASSAAPGAAPEVSLMPVRVLDDAGAGSGTTVAAGIVWAADHGAQVINLSIGDSGPADRFRKGGPIALAMRAVADRAVIVVAAGNDAQYEELFRAGVPGIVVVATDSSGNPAPFTNVGDTRAVAAPGVDIVSTAPDYATALFPGGTDGYASLSGTSMAAPFVSAEAALLIQAGLTPAEVRATVPATATNPSGDPQLGAGIIDAAAAVGSVPAEVVTASADVAAPADEPSASPDTSEGSDDAADPGTADAPRDVRWGAIGLGVVLLILIGVGIGKVGRRKE